VVFDNGHPERKEQGGRIFQIHGSPTKSPDESVAVTFPRDSVDFSFIYVGDKVWKTSDPELDRELRETYAGDKPRFQRPIAFEVHGHAGAPLTVIARDEMGNMARADSAMPLAVAETRPLTAEKLSEQLGRLGGTPFRLGELKNRVEGDVMLPVSELNRLRRELVTELESRWAKPKRWTLHEAAPRITEITAKEVEPQTIAPELVVLIRSLPQLDAALKCGVETVYCEFEDSKKYREAVTTFHTARGCSTGINNVQPSIWVAPPRITKPGEEWILNQVRSCNADGYLVRNYDHLKFFADCRRRGDFSLNVANQITAKYFLERYGLERLTASYDLNFEQLTALLRSSSPASLEITIHQHMPMFHMEHCVFCAFLSSGTDYRNCGRPCDTLEVKLRDRVGMEHPLKADAGCRNTLFNARAQTGAEYVGRMMELGARHFRLEFLNESPEEVTRTITMYRRLLRGEVSGTDLWRELKVQHQLGVTRGQMEKPEKRG
jgi:U32 family peptidase